MHRDVHVDSRGFASAQGFARHAPRATGTQLRVTRRSTLIPYTVIMVPLFIIFKQLH
jgi:hypothetical protein